MDRINMTKAANVNMRDIPMPGNAGKNRQPGMPAANLLFWTVVRPSYKYECGMEIQTK
jgi:hypothetical protein